MDKGYENHAADYGQTCYQWLVAPVQYGIDEVVTLLARVELDGQTGGLARDGNDGGRVSERSLFPAEPSAPDCPIHHREYSVGQSIGINISQMARLYTPSAMEEFSPSHGKSISKHSNDSLPTSISQPKNSK